MDWLTSELMSFVQFAGLLSVLLVVLPVCFVKISYWFPQDMIADTCALTVEQTDSPDKRIVRFKKPE